MRQFYGRLEKCVLSAGKTHVHKIPRFRGGGVFWVLGGGGGGECRFYFYGRADFSEVCQSSSPEVPPHENVFLEGIRVAHTGDPTLHILEAPCSYTL